MSLTTETILTITEVLETSINLALKQDPSTLEKMAALQGNVIAFEITDLNFSLYLFPHSEGVQVQYLYQETASTTLQGSIPAFIKLSLGDSTESFFSGEIRIKGDIELGQHFKRILEQLDLDWEEWLSQYSGDLIAHKTGQLFRQFTSWGKDALNTLELDAREYIQTEGQLSPQSSDLETFSKNISLLRNDMARLEARLSRLQKNINSAT